MSSKKQTLYSHRTRKTQAIKSSLMINAILISVYFSAILLINQVKGNEVDSITPTTDTNQQPSTQQNTKDSFPVNHKNEPEDNLSIKQTSSRRQSRQYDGTMSPSSVSGNYAAIANDAGAYVGQLPASSNYATPAYSMAGSSYSNDPNGAYQSTSNYHDLMAMARGYTPASSVPGYPSLGHHPAANSPSPSFSGMFPQPTMFPSATGFSSSMFPLMSKGFDVSEIVCTAIAVAIGAVIVGAPFILIYLFIMNQMNGNVGPNGGSISLTGPTSSTTVSGRKKRHASLPEALFKQLGPLVNNEQVAQTFKVLMNSIAKYQ